MPAKKKAATAKAKVRSLAPKKAPSGGTIKGNLGMKQKSWNPANFR